MTENHRKLAESLEGAAPDAFLENAVLENAAKIRASLETNGEYVLEDGLGNSFHITLKNGNPQVRKSQ